MPARLTLSPTLLVILCGWGLAGCQPARDPEALWVEAKTAFEARDWARTEADLDRLRTLREPTADDWILRAQVLIAKDENDRAIEALEKIPDGHKMAATAHLQIGQIALRRSQAKAAETAFLKAIEINPAMVQARRELIYLYGMQSRWKPMAQQFRVLAEMSALSLNDVVLWCLSRNMKWDPDEIQTDLTRFLASDPTDRDSRLSLIENLRARQFFDEAEAAVKPLPADDPDARVARVQIALDRGDVAGAEALLQEGPVDHPGLAKLRGKLALHVQDGPTALKHYLAAYRGEPDDRDVLFGLGSTLALVGKKDEAAVYLKKARDYDAIASIIERLASTKRVDNPRLLHTLGRAYEKVGRIPEAKAWFGLAIARDPLDSEAQAALFRLNNPADPKAGKGS